jgi:hypothetical protein
MGQYLDLLCDAAPTAPSARIPTRDISDQSPERGVQSLLSLISQPKDEAANVPSYRAKIEETAPADHQWWRKLFEMRARRYYGLYERDAAERLAWGELQNRWHMTHGARVRRALCAGCGKRIEVANALDLIDGTLVHLTDDYECLRRYGEHWRGAATRALVAMGVRPPAGEDVG